MSIPIKVFRKEFDNDVRNMGVGYRKIELAIISK